MINPFMLKILAVLAVGGAAYYLLFKPLEAAAQPAIAATEFIETTGEAINEGVDPIVDVVTAITDPANFERPAGTGGAFFEGLFTIGADVQRALTGGLTWREQAVLDEKTNVEALTRLINDVDAVAPRPTADKGTVNETGALNIANTFNDQVVAQRLTNTISNTINGNYSDPFGGFGSAVNQEAELRKAIQASIDAYPEWFK